jgi:hypothetical protein
MGIQTSLDAIHEADRLVDSMRLADDLALDAARTGGARTIRVLRGALGSDDQLVAIAATNALAQVFDEQADDHCSSVRWATMPVKPPATTSPINRPTVS